MIRSGGRLVSAGLAIARRGLAAKPPSLVASRHIVPRTLTVFPKTLVRRQASTTTTNDTFTSDGISSSGSDDSDSDGFYSYDAEQLEGMCERALEGAVGHVPQLGWSREALEAACHDLNMQPGLHSIAMPKGAVDLVFYFYESRNNRLADELTKWRADGKYPLPKPNSFGFSAPPPFETKQETDDFLRRAVEYRLRLIDEVKPQWKQAMGILALPPNIPPAIGLEAQIVDEIWAQAGDRSVDMNWYAKRLGLAYVYKLTELFYIQDSSPDNRETWQFLERRVADLRAMKEAKLKGISNMLREGIFAAGHVTSNILGWNCKVN